jgi:hypothetical protein
MEQGWDGTEYSVLAQISHAQPHTTIIAQLSSQEILDLF